MGKTVENSTSEKSLPAPLDLCYLPALVSVQGA